MIIEIKEYNYKGFLLQLEKEKGWSITLGDETFLFPHAQAAESAINEFIRDIVPKHEGKKIKKRG